MERRERENIYFGIYICNYVFRMLQRTLFLYYTLRFFKWNFLILSKLMTVTFLIIVFFNLKMTIFGKLIFYTFNVFIIKLLYLWKNVTEFVIYLQNFGVEVKKIKN